MKIKKAFQYRMLDALKGVRIYYLVMVLVFAAGIIMMNIYGKDSGMMGGFEMAGMTFVFILGLNSFKEYFYELLQHGISRKTGFFSFGITLLALAPVMALVDSIMCAVASRLTNYYSAFEQVYGGAFTSGKGISFYLIQFVWICTVYLAAGMAGYLITILYYRMNKAVKIAVSVGVPVFIFTIMPTLDYVFFHGKVTECLTRISNWLLGVGNELHPSRSMLTCVGAAVIFGAIAYLLSRKAAVKKA